MTMKKNQFIKDSHSQVENQIGVLLRIIMLNFISQILIQIQSLHLVKNVQRIQDHLQKE